MITSKDSKKQNELANQFQGGSPISGITKHYYALSQICADMKSSDFPNQNKDLARWKSKHAKVPNLEDFVKMRPSKKKLFEWLPEPLILKTALNGRKGMIPVDKYVKLRAPRNQYERDKLNASIARKKKAPPVDRKVLDVGQHLFSMFALFGDLYTEGDYLAGPNKAIVPMKVTHTGLEEHGTSTESLGHKDDAPPIIYECILKILEKSKSFLKEFEKYGYKTKNALTPFTLTGFPYLGPSASIESAAIAMAMMKIGVKAKEANLTVREMRLVMQSGFGDFFLPEIYRSQTIGKDNVEWFEGSLEHVLNYAARQREVFPSSKCMMAMIKKEANLSADCLFLTPWIVRGPLEGGDLIHLLMAHARKEENESRFCAYDGDKADKHQGGKMMDNAFGTLERLTGLRQGEMSEEYNMPFIQIRGSQIAESTPKGQLASGGAGTTPSNCVTYGMKYSIMLASQVTGLSITEVTDSLIKMMDEVFKLYKLDMISKGERFELLKFKAFYSKSSNPARLVRGPKGSISMCTFGDDMAGLIPKSVSDDEITDIGKKVNLSVSREKTDRFLGVEYGPGLLESSQVDSYNLGRMVSQAFFPERNKEFLYRKIGHLSRIEQMPQGLGETFNERIKPFWHVIFGCEYMTIKQMKEAYFNDWMPEATKKGNVKGELWEALAFLTKGDSDLLYDLESNPMITEEVIKALDGYKIDLDDDIDEQLSKDYKFNSTAATAIRSITTDRSTWVPALKQIFLSQNLKYEPGSVVY